MDEGDSTEITQRQASAVQPLDAPAQKTLWERLKPLWWLRGVLGALALVGFLDQLGWVREKWLPVAHAITTRWSEGIAWLSHAVSALLPFHMEITPWEGHYLVVIFALVLPSMIPALGVLLRPPRHKLAEFVVVCFVVVVTNMVVGALLPGQTTLITDFAPIAIPGLLIISAVAIGSAVLFNKPYFQALFLTLTFIGTLEVIYLAPILQNLLQPLVDWISAGTTSAAS
ncbi:MAG TPA: hypothetical protein VG942_10320 [Hyphomonadaceae bacterium]|nr:hypothetical protein [Hyphomonadaceae bacterium]